MLSTSCSAKEAPPQKGDPVAVLRAHPQFASHLLRAVDPEIALPGSGYASRTLRVDLPDHADGAVKMSIAGRPGAWMTLTPIDLRSQPMRDIAHARVFERARTATDIVHVVEPGRYEETRVLATSEAPASHSWSIALGPDLAFVRVREHLVEAVDRTGFVVFVQHPPFALDALGVKRSIEPVLEGAKLTLNLDRTGLAHPVVLDPTWTVVAPLATARALAGITLLPDGRVLVAGGRKLGAIPPPTTAEVYDPKTNVWTFAGNLPATTGGFNHALHVLPGGKAIAIGGWTNGETPTAIWNGGTTWTLGAPRLVARQSFGQVRLNDGRILIMGGGAPTGEAITTAEIYDPAGNVWTNTGPFAITGRTIETALLKDGRVMVAGGMAYSPIGDELGPIATVEIFNPATATWSVSTPMPEKRDGAALFVRPSGDVDVIQGFDGTGTILNRRRFHPSTATWDPAEALNIGTGVTLTLSDGRGLFPNSVDAIVHDPVADTFLFAGATTSTAFTRAYVALADGRAMEAGGRDGTSSTPPPVTEVDIWAQYSLGAACVGDFECKSAHCADGACCSVASCGVGSTCSAAGALGTCKKLGGSKCAVASDCGSGFCTDGVCCDRACTGQCEACDDPFALGKCKAAAGAPHGTRAACSDGAGNPCQATTCDGTDATVCHRPTTGVIACGSNACASGIEAHVGTCNGAGTCIATTKSCGAYACGASACKTTCTASSECATGYWCSAGACVPTLSLGKVCADASACDATLACVDGVCCGSASCPAGGSCALPGHEGVCFQKQGSACTVDASCATGLCVDGVCCDATCEGQCEACNAKGSEGTCTAITGPPAGARPSCTVDAANPCKSSACNGVIRTSCEGLAGSDVTCEIARCDAGTLTPAALCDGKGGCAKATTASCSGFTCADASACRTRCADDGDCIDGYHCDGSNCVAVTATCSSDGTATVSSAGATVACAPYRCRAGICLGSCATSADCAGGTVCSFATKTCVSVAEAAGGDDSSGGCTTGRGRGTGGLALFAFALGIFVARRRALLAASLACGLGCAPSGNGTPARVEPAPSPLSRVRAASPALAHFAMARASRTIAVTLPERADGPLHLVDVDDPAMTVDVFDEDARGQASITRVIEGARVHEGALPATTVIHAHQEAGAEEIRILEDRTAPPSLHLRVIASSELTLRVREGRIEALDSKGRVRIGSAPMWAIDAKHVRRDLELHDGGRDERGLHVVATLDVSGLAWPIVVDPAWSNVASMKYVRVYHSGTLLADGRVLVAGGAADDTAGTALAESSAEIYDPTANTWTSTGALGHGRFLHAATRLGAKVLVAGGSDAVQNATATAETWDPATGLWTAVAPLPESRQSLRMATLPSGKVLAFSSFSQDPFVGITPSLKSFVFDPAAGSWSSSDMINDRSEPAMVQLADGSVLALGGYSEMTGASLSTAERFDPTTGKWSAIAPLKAVRVRGGAAAFSAGKKVLLAGGGDGTTFGFGALSTTEIYDVTANTWTVGPAMEIERDYTMVSLLASGRVLVAGGAAHSLPVDSWQVLDPVTATFVGSGSMPIAVQAGAMVPMLTGDVLIAGGQGGATGETVTRAGALRFALQSNGKTCTSAAECTSGFCTEGVCCSSATCAAGSTCAGAAAPGACTKRDAVTCTTSAECANGFCVDGVCCESACTAGCAACDVPGNLGRCRPVKGAPHGARSACSATTSECGLACDGADTAACHPRPSGAPCGTTACSAGKESHPSTCDGAGVCVDSSASCGAYGCGPTSCKTGCAKSADCATGYACSGSTCVTLPGKGTDCSGTGACGPGLTCLSGVCCSSATCGSDSVCPLGVGDCVKLDGASCAGDTQCKNGHCVDGICCDSSCDGPCGACDLAGREGKCTAVAGAPHGTRTCPTDPTNVCAAARCNGADKTSCAALTGADTSCRAATCVDGKATTSAFCDGKGACPTAIVSDCKAYRCNADGTACRDRCTEASDCIATAWCNAGKCEPLAGTCSADGASLDIAGSGSVSCAPFVCRDNTCVTSCESTSDCSSGSACDTATKSCLPGTPEADSGGCAIHAGGESEASWIFALLAVAALRRRQSIFARASMLKSQRSS